MAKQKPAIPKGTRDFSPTEMVQRNYIFNTIKQVFTTYGYLPLETPAMENLSTLLGKYGDEGDKLLFKILNSGDFWSKVDTAVQQNPESGALVGQICEKGLRYDLTVPFARYVVQHRNDLQFPFKRYQIQPVWRADRPQKGRYREFYQCDVDVIGSDSLFNEVELIQIVSEVFKRLNINIGIKFNNRKILAGIAQTIGQPDKMTDITVAIDKLDKIGLEQVNAEMEEKGIPREAIEKIQPIILLQGSTSEKLEKLDDFLQNSEIGRHGIVELRSVFDYLQLLEIHNNVELDLTLARGLNYYTGAIIEVKAADVQIGSICGGGRYDDLTGIFGLDGVSGVGVSFGADRIYDVMLQLDLFPSTAMELPVLLFTNFGDKEARYCLPLLQQVRHAGVRAEMYPDAAKMKKQMTYANKKGIRYVALVGESEMSENKITLKDMESGTQDLLDIGQLVAKLASE